MFDAASKSIHTIKYIIANFYLNCHGVVVSAVSANVLSEEPVILNTKWSSLSISTDSSDNATNVPRFILPLK